jgi:hypothetical protein
MSTYVLLLGKPIPCVGFQTTLGGLLEALLEEKT